MKTTVTKFVALICVLLATAHARAESGVTNVISAVVTNYTGNYMVGSDGAFNALIVTNSGVFTVTGSGVIGNSSVSSNNVASVSGAGSAWTNSGALYVGNGGSFNQLTISGGGRVASDVGIIGSNVSAGYNSVLVTGAGSVWTNRSTVTVGYYGLSNSLSIFNGGYVTCSNVAGALAFGTNSAVVSGAGSVWRIQGSASFGSGLNGSSFNMTITNGGQVFDDSVTVGGVGSWALVTGVGSVWSNNGSFIIGNGASDFNNKLTVSNGAQVFSGHTTIGRNMNNGGHSALVTGTGSFWKISGDFRMSDEMSGNTSLTISNGGQVSGMNSYVGIGGVSWVTVDGPGSIWTNGDTITLGALSASSGSHLTVTNGGQVFSAVGNIGSWSSKSNEVLVTGSGSLWKNTGLLQVSPMSSLSVANYGTVITSNLISAGNVFCGVGANLFVTNVAGDGVLDVLGGTLTLSNGTVTVNRLIATNGASSVVNFNGGTLNTGGSTVSNGVPFRIGNGTDAATLNLMGGTHSFFDGLIVTNNAQITGTGTIVGDIANPGTIAPGNSPGTLTVNGRLILFTSSMLDMELGGTNAGAYDQLVINGELAAAGTLDVMLTNGFTPAPGDLFRLFDFDTVSGGFSQTNLPYGLSSWNTSHLLAPSSDPLSGSLIFIPEPTMCALLLAGLGGLLSRRRR